MASHTPITPEGVISYVLLHDGENVAAQDVSGNIALYSVEEKPTRSVPGTNDMLPVQWSVDGHSVFTTVPDEIPARVLRIDLTSGRQELVRRFSYRQTLSDLYVSEGLH